MPRKKQLEQVSAPFDVSMWPHRDPSLTAQSEPDHGWLPVNLRKRQPHEVVERPKQLIYWRIPIYMKVRHVNLPPGQVHPKVNIAELHWSAHRLHELPLSTLEVEEGAVTAPRGPTWKWT
ncbi:hypothetical protein L6R49_29080 [Myxococcota bacterium]|nr:hypothetical protein [Myxococcota bacterium]